MTRHTTMKKRGAKSGSRTGKRGARSVTRKRGSRTGKRGARSVTRKRGGSYRNRFITALKSPLTAGGDAAAGRRLAQAVALRLGFEPKTIRDIMGESRLKSIPNTISKNTDVINDLETLGRIGATCDDLKLETNGKTSTRNRFVTALKSPLTTGGDAAAGRRLLQVIALRLGFEPQTIRKIMGESRLNGIPKTVIKNSDIKADLADLGQITGNCRNLIDKPLDTDKNIEFKDFGNTGNFISRRFSSGKADANILENLRKSGVLKKNKY